MLPILFFGTLGLEIFIANSALTSSNAVGGIVAIVLHWTVFTRLKRIELSLLILLLAISAWIDLTPLILRSESITFNWLPFQGVLDGSLFVNAQAAAGKFFAYGSMVYLLQRMGAGDWISVLAPTGWVAGIEVAQTYVVNHTPESTNPLLVVFAALAILAIEGLNAKQSRLHTQAGETAHRDGHDSSGYQSGSHARAHPATDHQRKHRAVIQKVNLNAAQAELLDQLAEKMQVSVSEASRKIIGSAIEEAGRETQNPDELVRRLRTLSLRGAAGLITRENENNGWLAREIELYPDHYEVLQELSAESGSSISRVIRRIVDRFFSQLESETG
ncbi:hypothetical protein [Denitrobaculum tricleocarpae]|uniref:Uncharacterized protein n=1 Tax=Denitrobaculum tricleocarpae TaxID=2591009 RepID=A0A545TGF0_9PROT|nr:hypothetical protein [Denitrobaculum tricleocarpae]TQV76201.1 hypothetical protein FKG95_21425 [Denitrobaculum tricleocarpae]